MAGIAKVTLVGNLGRDPETRYTSNGVMNVSFTMAVTRRRTDQSGQPQESTTWFRVTAWRKLAEVIDSLAQRGFVSKGRQVFVLGTIEAREYQGQDGQTRTSLDVTADEFQLLGNRSDNEGQDAGYGQPQRSFEQRRPAEADIASNDFDDVPF
jgi:single-strand DNA-binding protein